MIIFRGFVCLEGGYERVSFQVFMGFNVKRNSVERQVVSDIERLKLVF